MKLFTVHCGYYDRAGDGVYESHLNLFVVAEDFAAAKKRAKEHPLFREKRMHVDGIQEITQVDGYRVAVEKLTGVEGTHVSPLGYDAVKSLLPN